MTYDPLGKSFVTATWINVQPLSSDKPSFKSNTALNVTAPYASQRSQIETVNSKVCL
jgi:hypothetical protein